MVKTYKYIKISKHALKRVQERQIKNWTNTIDDFQRLVNKIPYKGCCLNLCKEHGAKFYPSQSKYLKYIMKHQALHFKKVRYYVYKGYMWILNNDETVLITMYPTLTFEDWVNKKFDIYKKI